MKTAAVVITLLLAPAPPAASPPSEALRRRAIDLAYNLDFKAADATVRQAIAADSDEPANHLALASISWIQMLFRRGGLTVDEYLGPPSLSDLARPPVQGRPPADFRSALTRATALAEARLRRNPRDVSALYTLGAAAGREGAHVATAAGRLGG